MSRRGVAVLVAVALAVSLAVAVFAAPWASGAPDGLERVAIDHGFDGEASEHALAESPAADDSMWAWRAAGVVLVFGLATGVTVLSARRRRDPAAVVAPGPPAG